MPLVEKLVSDDVAAKPTNRGDYDVACASTCRLPARSIDLCLPSSSIDQVNYMLFTTHYKRLTLSNSQCAPLLSVSALTKLISI